MPDKRYNQFIQRQMRNEQPDKEKLISIASLIRKEFGLTVQREAILTFDKETGQLKEFASWITEEQYRSSVIHVPDLLFFIKGQLWILELDGYIHYCKTSVAKKDLSRNECYERANLNVLIISEWEVLIDLGLKANRSANVNELWPTIKKIIENLV
ncbi:MAG: hypothetical protein ACW99F_14380 [Candidatus Hodarchaeales archaeon]|jgi:hypothetical protein